MFRLFIFLFLIISSCKNLDLLTLYDVEIKNTEGINGFTSTEIFTTGGSDEVWGMSGKDEFCNPFRFSSFDASINYSKINEAASAQVKNSNSVSVDRKYNLPTVKIKDRKRAPKNSIHLKTEKNPACEWIGMGIGWDGWQGKDMSRIMQSAAIEFVARVDKGYITSLPIVFILEDYSENQCYATANYLGIEGGKIDESWTKVIVPLQSFSYIKNKLDLTNIKQLLLQCYDATDVYLDNIKIVSYTHPYKKLNDNLTVYDSISPITIFDEQLTGVWGVDIDNCSNFTTKNKMANRYISIKTDSSVHSISPITIFDEQLTGVWGVDVDNCSNFTTKNKMANRYISIKTDSSVCDWLDFGISWNNWLYTDISNNVKDLILSFDLKTKKAEDFVISFEDYSGKKLSYVIKKTDIKNNKEWRKIKLPLHKFPIRKSKVDLTKIKQIHFAFRFNSEIDLDNIILTKK